jgi:uncharacterized protein (TIGR00730 family)
MSGVKRPEFVLGVFCGARTGNDPAHLEGARLLGQGLARKGIGLAYGGAVTGMMGILASACLDEGGFVEGVMPEALRTYEIAHPRLSSMIWTRSLSERKALLIERSNAFAVLPGGIGTCDELFEVATKAQLGLHSKPTFVLNSGGYFDSILLFVRRAIADGFADAADAEILRTCPSAGALLDMVLAFAHGGASHGEAARRRTEAAILRELQSERLRFSISRADS